MLTALLLAGAAAAQADVTRTGKTFAVTVHPGKLPAAAAVQIADAALAAAERVRPALDKFSLCPAKTPVIHVHADERNFRALAADVTKLAFHVEGFVQLAEGCAHVLLWPSLDASDYALVGLPPGTEHQVMLQAVQFAVFQRYAWVKVDPWRAGVIAHGIVDEILNPDAATGVDPMFDDRRSWHAEQFAKGKAPKLREELEWTAALESRGAFDATTEAMGLIAQTLAAAGSGWARKLLVVPDEKLPGMAAQRAGAVESILGKDWKRNEDRFTKVLSSLRPRWWVSAPIVTRRGGRLLLVGPASPQKGATLAALEPPPAGGYAIRATCELVPGRATDLRVQLDWDQKSLLACFVEPDEVWVSQWEAGSKTWKKLGSRKSPVVAGRPFALSVEVDAKVRVVIDDTQVLEVDYGKRTMRGEWSVEKERGPVWVTDLRCEPLAPPKKK